MVRPKVEIHKRVFFQQSFCFGGLFLVLCCVYILWNVTSAQWGKMKCQFSYKNGRQELKARNKTTKIKL